MSYFPLFAPTSYRGGLLVPEEANAFYKNIQDTLLFVLGIQDRVYNAVPLIMNNIENDWMKTLLLTLMLKVTLFIGIILTTVCCPLLFLNKFCYDLVQTNNLFVPVYHPVSTLSYTSAGTHSSSTGVSGVTIDLDDDN